jgi:hypothetical protein
MQTLKTLFCRPEFQAFAAGLAMLIFSWPVVTILAPVRSAVVFYYFFASWGLVIVLLLLVAISHRPSDSKMARESEPKE